MYGHYVAMVVSVLGLVGCVVLRDVLVLIPCYFPLMMRVIRLVIRVRVSGTELARVRHVVLFVCACCPFMMVLSR